MSEPNPTSSSDTQQDKDLILLECFLFRDLVMCMSRRETKYFDTDNSIRMMADADRAMNSTLPRAREYAKARSAIFSFYREKNGEDDCGKWLRRINFEKLEQEENVRHAKKRSEFQEIIAEYNFKYYFVLVDNHKPFILSYIGGELKQFTKTDFQTYTIGEFITTMDKTSRKRHQKSDIWLKSGDYIRYTNYGCFPRLPSGPHGTTFNIWPGFATKPEQGNFNVIYDYFFEVLANNNMTYFKEIIQFFGHMVQKPWDKPEKCIVLIGDYASGKSVLVKLFRVILDSPDRKLRLCRQDEDLSNIFGDWTDHLETLLLLGLDEIRWRFVPQLMGRVKGFNTNSTLPIKTKFLSERQVESHIRLVITNNPEDRIPVALHERRRYDIFHISDKYKGDKAFWDALFDEAYNGGAAAFLDYLMNVDLDDFNPREAIVTEELLYHKIKTLEGIQDWWMQNFAVTGQLFYDGVYPDGSVRVNKADLRASFNLYRKEVMKQSGEISDRIFGIEFMAILPVIEDGKIVMNDDGRRAVSLIRNTKADGYPAYIIPSLAKVREVMEFHLGGPHDWDTASDMETEANEYWAVRDEAEYEKDKARVASEYAKLNENIKLVGGSFVGHSPGSWVKIDRFSFNQSFTNARYGAV